MSLGWYFEMKTLGWHFEMKSQHPLIMLKSTISMRMVLVEEEVGQHCWHHCPILSLVDFCSLQLHQFPQSHCLQYLIATYHLCMVHISRLDSQYLLNSKTTLVHVFAFCATRHHLMDIVVQWPFLVGKGIFLWVFL